MTDEPDPGWQEECAQWCQQQEQEERELREAEELLQWWMGYTAQPPKEMR